MTDTDPSTAEHPTSAETNHSTFAAETSGPTSATSHPIASLAILLAAAIVAIASARDYAGGWNDGSRLATVECLVDRHTLAIDESVFVKPPPPESVEPNPYPDDQPQLQREGTKDKLFINGRYYSDKSPLPALTMAGIYRALQWATEIVARRDPHRFCYWMTLSTSGLAYVAAVWCIYQLGGILRLALRPRLLLTASFALTTVAPAYARHVNSHILLLAVAAGLVLSLARLVEEQQAGSTPWQRVLEIGLLAGLGYTLDLGVGPVLVACSMAIIAYRTRRLTAVLAFALAAAPWIAAHHALNYYVGGTWQPANMVTEYMQWPGSPFDQQNMTGAFKEKSLGKFLLYPVAMLFGKHGFFNHNLPLLLSLAGLVILLRRRRPETPELIFSTCFFSGAWLLYAVTSNNYSGACCSIRWFVPLLAPGWYVLAVLLRDRPEQVVDLSILSALGVVLGVVMWRRGPWEGSLPPGYWQLNAAALVAWAVWAVLRLRPRPKSPGAEPAEPG
ncbi:MAG TPA: hypothetical protein VMV10_12385 [Pirellulales bacterium]|nr:hypothetical protein [Pirellulales bacterium]